MTAVVRQALGPDFERLHPMLQRRFGFSSSDGVACLDRGVMNEIRRGPIWTVPFLFLGTWRHIMFPESARNVPFTIDNYAYIDGYGRETLTFIRTFEISRTRRRRFDATMIYEPQRGGIVDYLGTHQHLAVDLDLRVDDEGALCLRSAGQRFYEAPIAFNFPLGLSGVAELRETYDDARSCYTIDVRVTNARLGPLFAYSGTFGCDFVECPAVPATVKPLREERRT